MATNTVKASDNVLGYSLKKKIGAGSYGEVWAAEAPGGISKAVKFIFGCHDENRAQNELKSLNKIKQVRHPFLLSLERIEVVDQRLVIVSELADMSLNDKFLSYREEGLPGIPRKELLRYMLDSADALDYIREEHSLQHLDIKPENLLLLGNHIKVADFGLVKEVQDATASLMSGLTPSYAPPELFDGRPNRSSDQYSLAVVYTEMVCGERLDGTTAAQLAVQHMQSKPNLSRLSPRDQGIVLKALAKDPNLRFGSCRDFIEELTSRTGRTQPKKKRRTNPNAHADDQAATVQLETGKSTGTMMLSSDSLVGIRKPTRIQLKGPINCDPDNVGVRPTLFIGVGGTGTKIVRNLQARIRKLVGSDLPAVSCLCIDTDRRSLIESVDFGLHEAVNYNEILEIPLRKPEQYRNDAKMHLNWLSRRWIYNIPRSLQTEGIRPLGRLAFVDNSDAMFTRLADIINKITTTNAIVTTAELTGLNPIKEAPRVYLVASIAGGVGSGCIVDMAYAIRTALAEMGLPDDVVTGILMHSTAAYDRDAQLAVANTYACLTELQHYTSYGYPGDDSCGLPSFDAEDTAFNHVYYVNCGVNLVEDAYEAATSGIAEYLFHNAISRCQPFHDSVRRIDDCEPTAMRTLGIASTDFDFQGETALYGLDLSISLIDQWLVPTGFDENRFADLVCADLRLTADEIMDSVSQTVVAQCGADFNERMVTLFLDTVTEQDGDWQSAVTTFDTALGRHDDQIEPPANSVRGVLQALIDADSESRSLALINAVFNLINVPDARIGGAHRAHTSLATRLRSILDTFQDDLQQLAVQQANLAETLNAQQGKSKEAQQYLQNIANFAALRVRETIVTGARILISTIGAQFSATLPQMVNDKRDIESMRTQLVVRRDEASQLAGVVDMEGETPQNSLRKIMETEFREQLPSLIPRVNEHLERNFFVQTSGLLGALQDESTLLRRQIVPEIVAAAQSGVASLMGNVDIDQLIRTSGISRDALTTWVGQKLSAAMPRSLELCGGDARLMLGIPESKVCKSFVEFVNKTFEYNPTTVPGTSGDVVFSVEGSNVPIANIAYALMEERPDCATIVSRLHTRRDVEWSKLTDLM